MGIRRRRIRFRLENKNEPPYNNAGDRKLLDSSINIVITL